VIDDPHFSLDLGPAWQALPPGVPGQYDFRDADRDILLMLTAVAHQVAPDALDDFASLLVALKARADSEAARIFAHAATIYEPIVVPRAWGRAVAYYGHDDSGRQFGFSGTIAPRFAIHLTMSSARLSEGDLMQAIDEVNSRIVFARTPLAATGPH
jgi:hypothetical protein